MKVTMKVVLSTPVKSKLGELTGHAVKFDRERTTPGISSAGGVSLFYPAGELVPSLGELFEITITKL